MHTIEISVSYFSKGKCITHSRKMQTSNPQTVFDNAVCDANVAAHLHKGKVQITRKLNSLYINYLDLKCDVIDRMYLIND
jgi:hypothetical protein